jgi:heat shock protein HslJ
MRSFNVLKILIVTAIFSVGIFAQEYSGKLVELNGKNVTNSKAVIDLKFRTGSMTGNAGCNRMFGSFSARGTSIRFSGIGTTRMFCTKPAGVMKQEAEFTGALRDATRYQIRGGTLRIYAGRRQLLRFERVYDTLTGGPVIPVDVNSPNLEDRKWVLDQRYSGIPVNSAGAPFINFTYTKPGPPGGKKGTAGGNTGCNVFGGGYSAIGSKIVISEIISTMRACIEDDRMDTERTFLDGLRKANRFEINREELSLYEDSTLLLKFYGRSK